MAKKVVRRRKAPAEKQEILDEVQEKLESGEDPLILEEGVKRDAGPVGRPRAPRPPPVDEALAATPDELAALRAFRARRKTMRPVDRMAAWKKVRHVNLVSCGRVLPETPPEDWNP